MNDLGSKEDVNSFIGSGKKASSSSIVAVAGPVVGAAAGNRNINHYRFIQFMLRFFPFPLHSDWSCRRRSSSLPQEEKENARDHAFNGWYRFRVDWLRIRINGARFVSTLLLPSPFLFSAASRTKLFFSFLFVSSRFY